MALTYENSAALMNDMVFRGRVKVAGLKYSSYILGEDPAVQGHSARSRWAQTFSQQPEASATNLQPAVVMDPQVQVDGAAISDEALQTAVEGVVNKFI